MGLDGHLADEDWTKRLRDFLEDQYLNDGVKQVHLDLSGLDRIDLEGVATLLVLSAEAIKRDMTLGVTGASGQVWRKLRETSALSHLDEDE